MQNHPPIAAPDGNLAPQMPLDGTLDLAAIAKWHRQTLLALVLGIVSDVAFLSTRIEDFDRATPVAWALFLGAFSGALGVAIFRWVSIYKLAKALQVLWPVLPALLSIWGVLGFIIALVFNKQARRTLRKNGVRVGFWSASPRAINP